MPVFAPVRNGFFKPSREFRDSRTRYYGIRESHQQLFFGISCMVAIIPRLNPSTALLILGRSGFFEVYEIPFPVSFSYSYS